MPKANVAGNEMFSAESDTPVDAAASSACMVEHRIAKIGMWLYNASVHNAISFSSAP